jgi:hypothetical protein
MNRYDFIKQHAPLYVKAYRYKNLTRKKAQQELELDSVRFVEKSGGGKNCNQQRPQNDDMGNVNG